MHGRALRMHCKGEPGEIGCSQRVAEGSAVCVFLSCAELKMVQVDSNGAIDFTWHHIYLLLNAHHHHDLYCNLRRLSFSVYQMLCFDGLIFYCQFSSSLSISDTNWHKDQRRSLWQEAHQHASLFNQAARQRFDHAVYSFSSGIYCSQEPGHSSAYPMLCCLRCFGHASPVCLHPFTQANKALLQSGLQSLWYNHV